MYQLELKVPLKNGVLNKGPFNKWTDPPDLNTTVVHYSDPHCKFNSVLSAFNFFSNLYCRRGLINGSLLIGLAAGILFTANRGLIFRHITRLGEFLHSFKWRPTLLMWTNILFYQNGRALRVTNITDTFKFNNHCQNPPNNSLTEYLKGYSLMTSLNRGWGGRH